MRNIYCCALIAAALSAGVTGCVPYASNYAPKEVSFKKPPLNVSTTAWVGDAMIAQGALLQHDAIYLPEDVRIGGYRLHSGYYLKDGETRNGSFYLPGRFVDGGHITGQMFAEAGKAAFIPTSGIPLCIVTASNVKLCNKTAKWEPKEYAVTSEKSFQRLLISGGRVDSKIIIIYQEKPISSAHPNFDRSMQHDLSASKTMTYRGARIEVIEATKESITYRLLSNLPTIKLALTAPIPRCGLKPDSQSKSYGRF